MGQRTKKERKRKNEGTCTTELLRTTGNVREVYRYFIRGGTYTDSHGIAVLRSYTDSHSIAVLRSYTDSHSIAVLRTHTDSHSIAVLKSYTDSHSIAVLRSFLSPI